VSVVDRCDELTPVPDGSICQFAKLDIEITKRGSVPHGHSESIDCVQGIPSNRYLLQWLVTGMTWKVQQLWSTRYSGQQQLNYHVAWP